MKVKEPNTAVEPNLLTSCSGFSCNFPELVRYSEDNFLFQKYLQKARNWKDLKYKSQERTYHLLFKVDKEMLIKMKSQEFVCLFLVLGQVCPLPSNISKFESILERMATNIEKMSRDNEQNKKEYIKLHNALYKLEKTIQCFQNELEKQRQDNNLYLKQYVEEIEQKSIMREQELKKYWEAQFKAMQSLAYVKGSEIFQPEVSINTVGQVNKSSQEGVSALVSSLVTETSISEGRSTSNLVFDKIV